MTVVRRSRLPRATLAAVAALTLAACTSGSGTTTPTGANTTGASTTGTSTTGAAGASTAPTAGQTGATGATATATAAAPTGAETEQSATFQLGHVLTEQARTAALTGPAGAQARANVYADDALQAANAAARLQSTLTADQRADLPLSTDGTVLLGVSRGAAYPRVIVATAKRAKTGAAVLLLLRADGEATGYRIVHQATLLPGQIGALHPVSEGSPLLADGSGLATAPEALLAAYAQALAYPVPADAPQPFMPDPFLTGLREGERQQAAALGSAVTLTAQHAPRIMLAGLALPANRGALVFAVLASRTTLTERTADAITAPRAVAILSGRTVFNDNVVMEGLEFVAFEVPAQGQARAIAASDQLVAASGS